MASSTNYTYINYTYNQWQCGGVITKNQTTTAPYTREDIISNDTQHRPYPSNPMDAMTDLPLQMRRTSRAAHMRSQAVFPNSCRPGASGPYNYTLYKFTENYTCTPVLPFSVPSNPDWQTKMRLAIKSLKVSLGQDLAEYRQSADMFKRAARGTVNALQAYRGLKRRKTLTPCAIPAADIIYSFGVAPLLGTVYDSVEKLRSTLDQPTHVKLIQSATRTKNESISNYAGIFDVKGKNTRSSRAEAHVWFDRGSAQFTLGNPLEIAWELVPYSFVFDYMIPVGDMLMALDALTGVQKIRGTVTHKDRMSCTYTHNDNALGAGYTFTSKTPGKSSYKAHSREVMYSIPMPSYPRWEPSASWHKLRHAVDLLILNRKC